MARTNSQFLTVVHLISCKLDYSAALICIHFQVFAQTNIPQRSTSMVSKAMEYVFGW
jgi:hypothetical protein